MRLLTQRDHFSLGVALIHIHVPPSLFPHPHTTLLRDVVGCTIFLFYQGIWVAFSVCSLALFVIAKTTPDGGGGYLIPRMRKSIGLD